MMPCKSTLSYDFRFGYIWYHAANLVIQYVIFEKEQGHYYFLAVILSCHWSKDGHVTKIFCDIVIRKSVFHGVLTARSIHLFMTLYSHSIHSPQAPLSF